MIKLNLKQPLRNLAGEPIKIGEGKNAEDVRFGRVLANSIIGVKSSPDAARTYILATKIYQQDEIELSEDDLTFLKDLMDKTDVTMPTLYKGQIVDLLNNPQKIIDDPKVKKNGKRKN